MRKHAFFIFNFKSMKAIFNILFISLFIFCLVTGLYQCGEATDKNCCGANWGGLENVFLGLISFVGAFFFFIILAITNIISYFNKRRKEREAWENIPFVEGEGIK